jgi:ribonuclease J
MSDDPSGNSLRLIPLGGFGEIGKNMALLECREQRLLIDAGIAFPDDDAAVGVDLLLPNWSYLRRHPERLAGIFLTHGHEDHIGALPFLLREFSVPVYGTALTLGLVKAKLGQYRVEADLRLVRAGDRVPVGCFEVECIQVNHSIPDALGLGIRTPAGIIYHSGDFKFDHTPIDGQVTDFSALARLGDEGVRLMVSDSTNIHRPGHTPSEAVVGKAFAQIFPHAPGRIIIATFASQIHRIQQVFDAAETLGRKVLVSGRSMERNVNVARELGYLHLPDDVRVSSGELTSYADDQVIVLITGSQGEPVSGLTRMAQGSHPKLRIHPDDTVIFSATPIPGNEATVWRIINDLMRRGAHVITHREAEVHVSGHAASEETKLLFNLIRPQFAAPFHGEYRHMMAYGELAQDIGLSHKDIFLLQNGDVLRLDDDGVTIEQAVEHGVWTVDGKRLNELGGNDVVTQDRVFLAESGVITATAVWDFRLGELVAPPVVGVRGVRGPEHLDVEQMTADAGQRLADRLAQLDPDGRASRTEVERAAKRALRSYFEKTTGTYPVLQFLLVALNEAVEMAAPTSEPEAGPRRVLVVDGEVDRPMALTLDDLAALRPESAAGDEETVALPIEAILAHAGLRRRATHLTISSDHNDFCASLPLEVVRDAGQLAFGCDDQPLDADQGGPICWMVPEADSELLLGATYIPQVNRLSAGVGPGRDTRHGR